MRNSAWRQLGNPESSLHGLRSLRVPRRSSQAGALRTLGCGSRRLSAASATSALSGFDFDFGFSLRLRASAVNILFAPEAVYAY